MEVPGTWKKEPEKPSVIHIEDRWNTTTQKRQFRIDAQRLTALAVRDFDFTQADITSTMLVIDSLFDIDDTYNTTIGVEEIHRRADRPVGSFVEDAEGPLLLNPAVVKDLIPDFLDAGLPVDVLAAHALREALSLKKAYLNHVDNDPDLSMTQLGREAKQLQKRSENADSLEDWRKIISSSNPS